MLRKVRFTKDCKLARGFFLNAPGGCRQLHNALEFVKETIIEIPENEAAHLIRLGLAVPAGPQHGKTIKGIE